MVIANTQRHVLDTRSAFHGRAAVTASPPPLLIPLAAPVGIAFVLAMAWSPPRTQLIGWAALSVWLLSTTYLGHGDQEYFALVAVVVLSLLGVLKSPWFLVAIWLLHPLWDVLHLGMDPVAAAIYDLIVLFSLVLAVRTGRLTAPSTPTRTAPATG